MNTPIKCIIGWLALLATARAAVLVPPVRLQLPLDGRAFVASSIEFDSTGKHICIAGSDLDDLGASTTRLLIVDLASETVLWQKSVPVPDQLATLDPVQCVVNQDRVFLLANAETSPSPPLAQSRAYVFGFDIRGSQIASRRLDVLGRSWYGYAMRDTAGDLKVAGYIRDQDGDTERYATYTVSLDTWLRQRGTPLLRKNGAYSSPLGARIVGDSIFLFGRFYPALVSKDYLGEYSASRLRTAGGYVWSTRPAPVDRTSGRIAVADDGTSYSLGYHAETTTLTTVTPDGKARAPLAYLSALCQPLAVARYGKGILAVREPCKGKGNALVSIDLATGKEQLLTSVRDEPMYVATKGSLWAVLARDKDGAVFLYSAPAGGL